MIFYRLPPAGNKIVCSSQDQGSIEWLNTYFRRTFFFDSGVASLSAAVLAAIKCTDKENAEVILPAYACPELVSAVLYAGAAPVLVDLEANSPWINLTALTEAITANTVAVIAVNLFGIPERIERMRTALQGHRIFIIEDSAQGFPEAEGFNLKKSDMVILSFGRGKPVSLLGGGAVVINNSELGLAMDKPPSMLGAHKQAENILKLKIHSYNCLISPWSYWLPAMMPFAGLGATAFKPLKSINQMDEYRKTILKENAEAFWATGYEMQRAVAADISTVKNSDLLDLAAHCCKHNIPRLLRYPLLARTSIIRDKIYSDLEKKGLGASKMYQAPLPRVQGLEGYFNGKDKYPNAASFARRLLTLPLHEGVTRKDFTCMRLLISRTLDQC